MDMFFPEEEVEKKEETPEDKKEEPTDKKEDPKEGEEPKKDEGEEKKEEAAGQHPHVRQDGGRDNRLLGDAVTHDAVAFSLVLQCKVTWPCGDGKQKCALNVRSGSGRR